MNIALLLLRVVAGLVMAAHGAQKLFGWFGGYGIAGTAGFFEQIGFRPGRPFATAAALAEFLGGLLIAVGFLGPIGPAIVLSTMIVAAVSVHWPKGLFAQNGGYELPLVYGIIAVVLALTGPGAYSIDAVTGLASLWNEPLVLAALVAGIVGSIVNLAARRATPVEG
jgi:putative oxidoreductase